MSTEEKSMADTTISAPSTDPAPTHVPIETSSSPAEMTSLPQAAGAEQSEKEIPVGSTTITTAETPTSLPEATNSSPEATTKPTQPSVVTAAQPDVSNSSPIEPVPATPAALGPATNDTVVAPVASAAPTLSITLMLTTGARHPYKIDEKYLTSRKVTARSGQTTGDDNSGEFDPREVSGYKLKELIWTDWRSEWEPRPASPSAIRLIILGKMVDDKKSLKEYPFHLDSPNILHMTVKPADFDDDEAAGGKTGGGKVGSLRARDGDDGRGAGCRCVIL